MAHVTKNVYTSAKYTVTLHFNSNGGGTVPSNVSASKTSNASSVTVTAKIPSTIPTRSGYNFLGWAGSASGSVARHPGDSINRTFTRQATLTSTKSEDVGGDIVTTYTYTSSNQSTTLNYYAVWEATGSTVSTTDGTLGVQQTLTITPLDPSYVHTLRYDFAGQTGTIASNVATSTTWTPSIGLAEYLTDAASAACTIYCDSYDTNNVLVGTTQTTITLSVPSNVKCTIASVTLAETVAGINAKFSAFVQNKSIISVTGTFNSGSGSPAYGATVQSVTVTINGQTLNGNGQLTNILNTSGTNSYTMTITDSRGRTDSYTSTFNVLAYNAPSVSMTAERDASTNSTINVSYGWTISACSNLNDKSITITYEDSGGNSTDVPITPGTYSGTGTYAITGTDISDSYDITVTVTDFFASVTNTATVAQAGNRILHFSATDKTISAHGANPEDGADHEYFPIEFHDAVKIGGAELYKSLWTGTWSSGNITVDGLSNYHMFQVRISRKSDHLLLGTSVLVFLSSTASNTYFRGIGAYCDSTSTYINYYLNATVSGDTLTWVACFARNGPSGGSNVAMEVSEIIGII